MRNKDVRYFRARIATHIVWATYRGAWYHHRPILGYYLLQATDDPDDEQDQRFTELWARLKNFYFDPKVIF